LGSRSRIQRSASFWLCKRAFTFLSTSR
jgi:hypothetical protein